MPESENKPDKSPPKDRGQRGRPKGFKRGSGSGKDGGEAGSGGDKGGSGEGKGGSGGGGNKTPNFLSRGAMAWILFGGVIVALLLLMQSASNSPTSLTWNEFYARAQAKEFKGPVTAEDTVITGTLKEDAAGVPDKDVKGGDKVSTQISPQSKALRLHELEKTGQSTQEKTSSNILLHIFIAYGPILLIAVLIYFFFFRSLRNAGGGPGGMLGNFGRSKHKVLSKEHSDVMLDDVAGIDEAKEEVQEVIEFLKSPKKFQRLGGRVPRGVLLIGQPGCGKTLLAKAVAGEADVPFFSISGSDFVEMFVGVGASRVRDLFKQAKDSAPCIIFLDEIDAVGRRRGNGFSSGGHDEREQTLNAILVEMDGFDSSDQVIVIASTNRADVLDPALTRPGRFDRQVNVPLPDIKGRLEILKVHSKKVKLSPGVAMEKLARGTPMLSGAELAAIINEAAIGATMQTKDFVEQADLEEARDKVKYGRSRKSHRIEEDEKKVIAYHEAGHATIMYHDEDSDPLHKVTIIPRGQGLGAAFMLPEKDRHLATRRQLLAQLRVTYGGRISEDMFCGDISSGAAMDIRQATAIARAMVTEYGMSERMGFLLYGSDEQKNPWEQPENAYSDETAEAIDTEIKRVIDQTYSEASQLLQDHREQLDILAQALLKYETLTREEVDKIMAGEKLDKATVSDLLQAERDREQTAKPGQTIAPTDDNVGGDTAGGAMPSPA